MGFGAGVGGEAGMTVVGETRHAVGVRRTPSGDLGEQALRQRDVRRGARVHVEHPVDGVDDDEG